jgi:hypothetical protein
LFIIACHCGDMNDSPRADQLWQPASFQERGVAVPFTTPALAGTRARVAARGVELIVPHPAGTRGVYIMANAELPHFCAATLHDSKLADQLEGAAVMSPATMAHAARAVAAHGYAGRIARVAAEAARAAEQPMRQTCIAQLLQALIRQRRGAAAPLNDLNRQAKAVLLELVPVLHRPVATLTADIDALAQCLTPGAAVDDPALLGMLGGLITDLHEASGGLRGASAHAARLVITMAELTVAMARRIAQSTEALRADAIGLLAGWIANHGRVAGLLQRQEWLLNGWAQTCLVWQETGIAARRGALSEMALMVPILPREAAAWSGIDMDEMAHRQLRALALGGKDWRSGDALMDLVARNERILLHAA